MNLTNPTDIIGQIYESGYYTNHGPLAKALEVSLQEISNLGHAVVASNESLALIMALVGLDLTGQVGVSPSCPALVFDGVVWAGLEPAPFAKDSFPSQLTAVLICDRPSGLDEADQALLTYAKSHALKVIVYQHGHFTGKIAYDPIMTVATVGPASESPSIHCAAILTADGDLAEKCRNIRSSYGARKVVNVRATANGRVSEYQAGTALVFLANHARSV